MQEPYQKIKIKRINIYRILYSRCYIGHFTLLVSLHNNHKYLGIIIISFYEWEERCSRIF